MCDAADKQTDADVVALKEEDACPAMPQDGYGWEKLFIEQLAGTSRRTMDSLPESGVTTRP
jgi:hypothetical protein